MASSTAPHLYTTNDNTSSIPTSISPTGYSSGVNISKPEQGQDQDGCSTGGDMGKCETSSPSPGSIDVPADHDNEGSRLTRFRTSKHFLSFTVGLAVFVDLLCYGIIMPLTPFIVEDLGLKSTANGALVACYAIGLLISSPVAGIISDKMANRRLLLVARFCAGLAGGTMMTLGFALLSDTYPSNQLGAEMGKVLIGQTLGLMVGPPLGGLLQDHFGVKAPYVFCMILIGIDLTARLLIIEPRTAKIKAIRQHQKQQQQEEQSRQTSEIGTTVETPEIAEKDLPPPSKQKAANGSTIRGLLTNKRLLTALVVSFIQAFLVAALEPVLPLYLERRFGFSKTQIGLTFLAMSIPSFVAPIAGWLSDKHGAKIMSAIAIALNAVFTVLLGIPGMPLWALIIFLIGIGATCSTYITPVLGEISAVVRVTGEGDGFARAFALFNMCFSLGMVAGPLLGSLIYQETSMLWTCVLIAIINVITVPLVLLYMGDKKQKLTDQAQYEKDMREEGMVLSQIQEQNK
ncbi:hypothetical protein BGZ65_012521 [Modicella reniformis]|uniref:Major facilitator superfamily (MFS) profile domain-containing protein n=1 Tax=Modicella reniformis TaxID=1440133 RepID=A0A9P6M3B2_9FUNG|nr:hypothetical protein BGZ65_012521 [Modicella reniformis]